MALNKRKVVVIAAAMTVLVVAVTNLASTQVMADMWGFFKRYEVHLSPEVSGRILDNGKPVSGLKVIRELKYDKSYIEETKTDSQGNFSFNEKIIRSRRPGQLFDETHNMQLIATEYEGEFKFIWYTVTSQIEYHPKTIREKLEQLNCDLKNPEQSHHFTIHEHPDFTHNVSSICRWQNETGPPVDGSFSTG